MSVSTSTLGRSNSSYPWLPQPKIVSASSNSGGNLFNLSPKDFMNIYTAELQYQDPFSDSSNLADMINASLELQQINYFTNASIQMQQMENMLSQMALTSSFNLIGKPLVFSTPSLDSSKPVNYYLYTSVPVENANIQITNSQGQIVASTNTSLSAGLNPISLTNLPPGSYNVNVTSNGSPVAGVELGFSDTVVSVNVSNNTVNLNLSSGLSEPISNIIYAGG